MVEIKEEEEEEEVEAEGMVQEKISIILVKLSKRDYNVLGILVHSLLLPSHLILLSLHDLPIRHTRRICHTLHQGMIRYDDRLNDEMIIERMVIGI